MPKLNTESMCNYHTIGNFTFSASRIDNLGASEYTLVTVALDISGSVYDFRSDIEQVMKSIVNACKFSPRANNLMLRVIYFNHDLKEMHGFKLLQDINPDDYSNSVHACGMTALYEATGSSLAAMDAYGKSLSDNDFGVNSILFVVTDGMDNASNYYTPEKIAEDVDTIRKSENMESILTLLIAIGRDAMLDKFSKLGKFDKYEQIANATPKTLAKLAEFISKSISAQSQALGTGGPSKVLPSLNI